MTKTELIKTIADKADLSPQQASQALDALCDTIMEEVADGGEVQIIGFGTFSSKSRAEREGINPQTKEKMMIPATKLPNFKAGKSFKDAVKG